MDRSIYCLVQPGGDIDEDDRDSKIACTELTILRRLTRKEFFLHALAYMVDHPGRKVSDKVCWPEPSRNSPRPERNTG